MQRQQGFTLLEMIIVITLVAGLSLLALVNIPNQASSLQIESRRLASILGFVSQRSELERNIYGLQLSEHEWKILKLCTTKCNQKKVVQKSSIWPEKYWYETAQGKDPFHQKLSDNIKIQLYIDNELIGINSYLSNVIEPIILFYPGGEITKFIIKLTNYEEKNSVEIKLDNDNAINYVFLQDR